jgi:hypothetical protein
MNITINTCLYMAMDEITTRITEYDSGIPKPWFMQIT